MESLKEITQFLNLDTRLDLQAVAVENILGMFYYYYYCN